MKEFNFSIDIRRKLHISRIEVVSGDTEANVFNIKLVDNYLPFDLNGYSANLVFKKPDGTTVFQYATIINFTEGEILLKLSSQVLAVLGIILFEIVLYGSNNERITTPQYHLEVKQGLLDENTVESTNEFSALTQSVSTVASFNGRITNVENGKADKTTTTDLSNKIGLLTNLQTNEKDDLVGAINENVASLNEKPNKTPVLSDTCKNNILNLVNQYVANRNLFTFNSPKTRDVYADSSCISNSKFYVNCSLFAQMVWMGRNISDFNVANYSPNITKAFNFGYYFNFWDRQKTYGVLKNANEQSLPSNRYYNFVTDDWTTFKDSYSANTYYSPNASTLAKQTFASYNYANDMAKELFSMGCEIKINELDVGDLIFFKTSDTSDDKADGFEKKAFRNITHVAIVVSTNYNGFLRICEASNFYSAYPIINISLGQSSAADRIRMSDLMSRVAMCARHPYAFGYSSNVPTAITPTPIPT